MDLSLSFLYATPLPMADRINSTIRIPMMRGESIRVVKKSAKMSGASTTRIIKATRMNKIILHVRMLTGCVGYYIHASPIHHDSGHSFHSYIYLF